MHDSGGATPENQSDVTISSRQQNCASVSGDRGHTTPPAQDVFIIDSCDGRGDLPHQDITVSRINNTITGLCRLCMDCNFSNTLEGCTDCTCRCSVCEQTGTFSLQIPCSVPSTTEILATGWPISCNFDESADDYTRQCLRIYDVVRSTGVPNFLQARMPLPHQLNIPRWRHYLTGHTDIALVDLLEFGFPVGFSPNFPLTSTPMNHASATNYPEQVEQYLAKEVSCHAMLGPFRTAPFWPWLHTSPIMTREKKQSSRRRIILDLSWPMNASVNAGTALDSYLGEQYKLVLPTVDDMARILAHFGQGSYLWALDLQRAFRQWRVDPLDWPIMGVAWKSSTYIDIAVAFGLRHGAAIAQRISQSVCDILAAESHTVLPYIDDYCGASPSHVHAEAGFARAQQLFTELGLEKNSDKTVPPTKTLTWIGVLFDSTNMTMSIPPTVLAETRELVERWMLKDNASRHELQQLMGKLFHAGKCSAPARLFVGRMLDTLRGVSSVGNIALSTDFKLDLKWWGEFLPHYNGVQLIQAQPPIAHVHISTTPGEVKVVWEEQMSIAPVPSQAATRDHHQAHRQIFGLLLALMLWGAKWDHKELSVHVEDPRSLSVLVHGRTRNMYILELARRVWLFTAHHDIIITPTTSMAVWQSQYPYVQCDPPPDLLTF